MKYSARQPWCLSHAALGVAAGALLTAFLTVSCAPAETPPPMVVIVIDTLRADHLGVYGYQTNPTSPNLDRRAASAAVFERAFSTAPWTLPAFGSLFTGQSPTRHAAGVVVWDVSAVLETTDPSDLVAHDTHSFYQLDTTLPTLGETLQAAGYRTAAIMNNAFLSPEFGLDRGFDSYDYDPDVPERSAAATTDMALAWLDARDATETQPYMLLVHYFDPHMPYQAPAPFLGRFAEQHADERFGVPVEDFPRLRYSIRDRDEGWERRMALEQALYDEEIAYTDHELERLLAALEERGLFEEGYVLLTSDHGEEFHDHGWTEHGRTVFRESIHVPLMMWGPDIEPGRYEVPVALTDVMPTLLETAGAEVVPSFGETLWQVLREGPSSRAASAIRFDRPLLAEGILYGDEKKALIRWPWKLMVDVRDDEQRLFDLEADPFEQRGANPRDLDEAGRDRAFRMLAELQAIVVEASSHTPARDVSLSEETLQRLRALGYIR